MAKFKDNKDQVWTLPEFTVGLLREVRAVTGFDFFKLGENGEELLKLKGDRFLACDVLCVLTDEERQARGLSDKDFAKRCSGPVMDEAWSAIIETYADFSRGPRVSAAVKENLGPMLTKIEDAFIAELKSIATGSPESSASTPSPSISGA